MNPVLSRLAVTLLFALGLVGCARQTTIVSHPEHARVYIGDDFLGHTPLTVHLSAGIRTVRLERPSYRPTTFTPRRQWDPRAITGVLFPPVLLIPAVSTTPAERYEVALQRGTEPLALGVVDGSEEEDADGPATGASPAAP